MPRRPNATASFAAILLVIAMLTVGYMGTYYAMLDGTYVSRLRESVEPPYRFDACTGAQLGRNLLEPAHRVDRWIRPQRWRA